MNSRTPEQLQSDMEAARLKFESRRKRYPKETAPVEDFHDDKPDGRPDLHVTTQPGDLDIFSRQLKPGS